ERLGRYPEAIADALAARATVTNTPYLLDNVGFIYARSGDAANARKRLDELEQYKKAGYAVRSGLALVHIGLREYVQAIDELEQALAAGETVMGLLTDPLFDEVRPLPRFQALLKQPGLQK